MPQKAVFDIADNAELTNFAMSKEPGDSCEITLHGKFISADGGKLELDIEELEYEYDGNQINDEPDLDEPVALEVFDVSDLGEASSKKGDEPLEEDSLLEDEESETN